VEQKTVQIYEDQAGEWARLRRAEAAIEEEAAAFGRRCLPGLPRADLGCGPGIYTHLLGTPVVALDADRKSVV
jgi:hypothetical protein